MYVVPVMRREPPDSTCTPMPFVATTVPWSSSSPPAATCTALAPSPVRVYSLVSMM